MAAFSPHGLPMQAPWCEDQTCKCSTSTARNYDNDVCATLARATCALNDGDADTAMQLLDACLGQQPGCADALWLRAQAQSTTGAYQAAFFDLRRMEQLAPDWPGLAKELQRVAAACSREARPPPKAPASMYARVRRTAGTTGTARPAGAAWAAGTLHAGERQHYEALGLQPGASLVDVRRAYKRLAALWHPDASRWVGAPAQERDAAGERFKALAAAHQALTSG